MGENACMSTKPKSPAPTSASEEPKPHLSEDSIPQDDGTDNEWQMEPLKEDKQDKEEATK